MGERERESLFSFFGDALTPMKALVNEGFSTLSVFIKCFQHGQRYGQIGGAGISWEFFCTLRFCLPDAANGG